MKTTMLAIGRDIEGCYVVNDWQGNLVATLPRDRDDAGQLALMFAHSPELISALRSLCIIFTDVCSRSGVKPEEYYSYRAAEKAIEEAVGESK